jgi:hypothetical protein
MVSTRLREVSVTRHAWLGNLGCCGESRGSLSNEVELTSLADSANLELGLSGCLQARLPRH